jgi:teichuronic acid biosynthesis glycosyltransferase TuaG
MTAGEKVSIIMPSYNAEEFIPASIASVIEQTLEDWELLICDDFSTDSTLEKIKSLSKNEKRIKIFRNKFNKGAAGARNTALEKASGRYIAFLDADDKWLPEKLEKQILFMKRNSVKFCYSYYNNINTCDEVLSEIRCPKSINFKLLLVSNFIPCLTAIYDTKYINKTEQPDIKKRNDFALWLKIFQSESQLKGHCLPEVLASYRVNNYGLSSNKFDAIQYYYLCVRTYGRQGRMKAIILSFCAVIIKAFKASFPNLYNRLISLISVST